MAENIGGIVSGLIPQGSSIGLLILLGVMFTIMALIMCVIAWFIYNWRHWNLRVEIKLPRSDGTIVNGEWGKGYFHNKRGVVYIKRSGMLSPKIPLKIFDPKRYLQGDRLITVVQLSPVDYRPVLPKSYLEHDVDYQDEETGEITTVKESILDIKCDTGHSKAWQQAFDSASKQAYSLKSFMQQFQTPIAIAIVLVAVFIGFAAVWTQLP
tara:strand:+ start:7050 stop:7679 length:630 start_codon:yes stop_codon:yes gene_type:complete